MVPIATTQLQPAVPDYSRLDYSRLREEEETMREKQKDNFDSHHRSRELTPLSPGASVWVTDQQTPGTAVELSSPRSYLIQTSSGMLCRNRRHLNPLPNIASEGILIEPDQDVTIETSPLDPDMRVTTEVPSNDVRCTRSRRISVPPSRLVEDQNWQ